MGSRHGQEDFMRNTHLFPIAATFIAPSVGMDWHSRAMIHEPKSGLSGILTGLRLAPKHPEATI